MVKQISPSRSQSFLRLVVKDSVKAHASEVVNREEKTEKCQRCCRLFYRHCIRKELYQTYLPRFLDRKGLHTMRPMYISTSPSHPPTHVLPPLNNQPLVAVNNLLCHCLHPHLLLNVVLQSVFPLLVWQDEKTTQGIHLLFI